jgi:hypothetical protein
MFTERWFVLLPVRENTVELTETRVYIKKKTLLPLLVLATIGSFLGTFGIGLGLRWPWYVALIVAVVAAVSRFFGQWRSVQLTILCIHLKDISAVSQTNMSFPLNWTTRLFVFVGGVIFGYILYDALNVNVAERVLFAILTGFLSLIIMNLFLLSNRRGGLSFYVPGNLEQDDFNVYLSLEDVSLVRSTIQQQIQNLSSPGSILVHPSESANA